MTVEFFNMNKHVTWMAHQDDLINFENSLWCNHMMIKKLLYESNQQLVRDYF